MARSPSWMAARTRGTGNCRSPSTSSPSAMVGPGDHVAPALAPLGEGADRHASRRAVQKGLPFTVFNMLMAFCGPAWSHPTCVLERDARDLLLQDTAYINLDLQGAH